MRCGFFSIWIFPLAIQTLEAQTVQPGARFEGKTVVSIRYDPPAQPLSAADLDRVQQVTIGSAYSGAAIAETIDRMFKTGVYSDIQVDAEVSGSGVAIAYLTKFVPFVGHVEVKGKVETPPSKSTLMGIAGFSLGDVFDDAALSEADKKITELFVETASMTQTFMWKKISAQTRSLYRSRFT